MCILILFFFVFVLVGVVVVQDDLVVQDIVIEFGGLESVFIEIVENSYEFVVELVEMLEQMQCGMMWCEGVVLNVGMLFCYELVCLVFMWMENMFVGFDIVYIEEDGLIVKIIVYVQL